MQADTLRCRCQKQALNDEPTDVYEHLVGGIITMVTDRTPIDVVWVNITYSVKIQK